MATVNYEVLWVRPVTTLPCWGAWDNYQLSGYLSCQGQVEVVIGHLETGPKEESVRYSIFAWDILLVPYQGKVERVITFLNREKKNK